MRRHTHITVELIGGLGNQLFCYYAGAALAGQLGVPLHLDTSWTRHGVTDHGIEILKFDLPGVWMSGNRGLAKVFHPGTFLARLGRKLPETIPSVARALAVYVGQGTGYDPALFSQAPGTVLRGYFQDWRIVERAVLAGYPRRPRLRRRSEWLTETQMHISKESPIGIHVRRGDYLTVPEMNALDPTYYSRAVKLARGLGFRGPLWLFSDDPIGAQNHVDALQEAVVIKSPDGAASELVALSMVPLRIIANSTFSWWSGWMAGEGSITIGPRVWLEGLTGVDQMMPPQWLRT